MKPLALLESQADWHKILAAAAIFLSAMFLFRAGDNVQRSVASLHKEFSADLELSRNRDRYKSLYEQMLSQSAQPEFQRIEQNDWIRSTQELVRRHQLLLQELTPTARKGRRENDLMIVIEGSAQNMAAFLREMSSNADGVSASRLHFSRQADKNAVEAQILLTQE